MDPNETSPREDLTLVDRTIETRDIDFNCARSEDVADSMRASLERQGSFGGRMDIKSKKEKDKKNEKAKKGEVRRSKANDNC